MTASAPPPELSEPRYAGGSDASFESGVAAWRSGEGADRQAVEGAPWRPSDGLLVGPTLTADKLDEPAWADDLCVKLWTGPPNLIELLIVQWAGGKDGDAPVNQLAEQKMLRQLGGSGRKDDAVEGCGLGPAECAIAQTQVDVSQAEIHQAFEGDVEKGLDAFDRVHLAGQLSQHCGVIARPGADLEDAMMRLKLKPVGHQGHHVGLRDGLAVADRVGPVGVHVVGEVGRKKRRTGDLPQRVEEPGARQTAFNDLQAEHFLLFGGRFVVGRDSHVGKVYRRRHRKAVC